MTEELADGSVYGVSGPGKFLLNYVFIDCIVLEMYTYLVHLAKIELFYWPIKQPPT